MADFTYPDTTLNLLYFGNFAQLDTTQGLPTYAENAASLVGHSFVAGSGMRFRDVTIHDTFRDYGPGPQYDSLQTNDANNFIRANGDYDSILDDNGVKRAVDIRLSVRADITFDDGSGTKTVSGAFAIMQLENGDIYAWPFQPVGISTLVHRFDLGNLGTIYSIEITHASPNSSYDGNNASQTYDPNYFTEGGSVIACFVMGTQILTPSGYVAIESLKVGDLVETCDNGPQEIRWIASKRLNSTQLSANPNLTPVRIRAGALAHGVPTSDLMVSQQHRILIRSNICKNMFGVDEVLAPAKHLTGCNGIDLLDSVDEIVYYHILFDRHEIIYSDGAETESFYIGSESIKMIDSKSAEEILSIFPEIVCQRFSFQTARLVPPNRQVRSLSMRHSKNNRSLVSSRSQ